MVSGNSYYQTHGGLRRGLLVEPDFFVVVRVHKGGGMTEIIRFDYENRDPHLSALVAREAGGVGLRRELHNHRG